MREWFSRLAAALLLATAAFGAQADGIGKIKTLTGSVTITRAKQSLPATLGAAVFQSDRIATGGDGSIGILFNDDSRLGLGPNSVITLDHFEFDYQSELGGFDVGVSRGTLSVISGKLTQKTPGALRVLTPSAILAVRGTEFSVQVDPREGTKVEP